MVALPRLHRILSLLLCSSAFLLASRAEAITEKEIRLLIQRAEIYEKESDWEKARQIYEVLLNRHDYGLKVRERYHHALRRCWQVRRHQDPSYRKEVLSIEYGQAIRLYSIINNTLLDSAVDKKKLDSARLFRKGVEELDAALSDPVFLQQHLPAAKPGEVDTFRALLSRTWGNINSLSRKDAVKQLGEVAMAAEVHLQLSATIVAMEFSCGACYAIDEFTAYLTPNQLRELAQLLSRNEIVGVGLKLAIRDNKIIVSQVDPNSEAAGLLVEGDALVSVAKKAVVNLPLDTVLELLRGPAGSLVEIEYESVDMKRRTVNLHRRATIASVTFDMPLPGIGYVKITGFTETTMHEIDTHVANLTQLGMKGLILDLRENNGGVFESAIETARRFLATGIITSTAHHDPKYNFIYQAKNPNALSVPLVVLVDGDTASAAEVLAGALKDNHRAILVGQTTFGKGCTQCLLKLPNALGGVPTGGLKLTVARFFSPKGVPYSGRGIVPHVLIEDRLAASQLGNDAFLERGIAELTRLMMMAK